MQEIIADTCKELDDTALALLLIIASENLIFQAICLNILIINAMPRRQAGLIPKWRIFMNYNG